MSYSIGEWVGKKISTYPVGKCLPVLNVTPFNPQARGQDTYLASLFHVSSPAAAKLFLMLNRN